MANLSLSAIRDEVRLHLKDPGISDSAILSRINEAYRKIAELVEFPGYRQIVSTTSQLSQSYLNISTALGVKFRGVVKKIFLTNNRDYLLYDRLEYLMQDYTMDESGQLEAFHIDGDILWYAKIPTAVESLKLLITTYPDPLEDDDDIPDLPYDEVIYKLLVNGACVKPYSYKEDEVEGDGNRVNTRFHFNESFNLNNPDSGIALFSKWVAQRRPPLISSRMSV